MPGAGDAVEVDEREPARTDDLEVVAGDRVAPPGLLDPPAIADLDRLAPATPMDRDEAVEGIELDVDGRMRGEGAGHRAPPVEMAAGPPSSPRASMPSTGRQVQRRSASGASGSVISIRRIRSSPNVTASRASCQPSRASRRAWGTNSGSCWPAAGSAPDSSSSRRATGAGGGVRSSFARSSRSIASASAVGSGKRVSTTSSPGVPARANARSSSRMRRPRAAARPRAPRLAASAVASRRRTNRTASSSPTGGAMGGPSRRRSAGRRGGGGGGPRGGGGGGGGHRRRDPRPGDPRAGRTREERLERGPDPLDEGRLGAPQGLEAVDLDLEQAEGDGRRIGRAGDRRAERGEPFEGPLEGLPVSLRFRIEEGRLRGEPVGRPERHSAPDAERPGRGVRVQDRRRGPGLAAQAEDRKSVV